MTHKTKPKALFLSFLALWLFILTPSCRLDDISPNPSLPHYYSSFSDMFAQNGFEVELRTVDASQEMVFTSAHGTNVKIPANSLFFQDGSEAAGAVEIQMIELLNKSDLVMSGLPLEDFGSTVLESVGGFKINAWKNNEQINLDGLLTLRFEVNPDNLDPLADPAENLSVFYNNTDNTLWEEANDQSSISYFAVAGGDIFELKGSRIGWISACRPYENTSTTTSLTLISNRNGSDIIDERAFVVFHDFNGMVELPKNGNSFSRVGLPLGQSATVVLMAFDPYSFYLATEDIVIGENETLDMNLRNLTPDEFIPALKRIDQ
jgi:hypothetical protein